MPEFNIPLAGSYNTRVSAVNAVGTSSGVVGAGIVGLMIVGLTGTVTTKDQRFINCFSETVINPYTQKRTIYTVKRPGFASSLTPQAGSIGNNILIWTGASSKIISAFGATNSSIYDSNTQLATNNADTTVITGKARSITETQISNVATLTIASSDSTAWYYQAAGTITKITDADFPGNNSLTTVGGFAHMDGYAFIMDSNGLIWNSDINSVTSWTAINSLACNSYPDKGIGVVRLGNKLMGFGTESVQFFQNAGNAVGSPLTRIENLTLKIGCVNADAITEVLGTVYWVGSSAQGGIGIYQYDSGPSRISTAEIETILLLVGAGNISLSAFRVYGRSFVIVQAGTITFCYCIEEKAWSELSSTEIPWYKCAGVSAGSNQVTYSVSKTSTSGKVYTINPASITFQDNGLAYTALIQTSRIGSGSKRTLWQEVGLLADRELSTSPITVSYSDDDYQNFTILGTMDLADDRPRLTRCGASLRRAWAFSHSGNTPMRLEAFRGRTA